LLGITRFLAELVGFKLRLASSGFFSANVVIILLY
jgi:hypothetical protein